MTIECVHHYSRVIQDNSSIRFVLDAIEQELAACRTRGYHSQITECSFGCAYDAAQRANLNIVFVQETSRNVVREDNVSIEITGPGRQGGSRGHVGARKLEATYNTHTGTWGKNCKAM